MSCVVPPNREGLLRTGLRRRSLLSLALVVPLALSLVLLTGCPGSGMDRFSNLPPQPTQPPEFFARENAFYVADTGNHRIVRLERTSPTGPVAPGKWEAFGTQGSGRGQFNNPSNVVFGFDNRIYVVDTGNNRIVRFDNMKGENWTELAQGFNAPRDLDINQSGELFIADTGNNRIVRFANMSGAGFKELRTVGNFGNMNAPTGVAYVRPELLGNNLQFANIFIADRGNNRILRTRADLSAAGQLRYGRPDNTPGSGPGEFNQPMRVVPLSRYFDVLDSGNNRIVSFTFEGQVVTVSDKQGLSQPLGYFYGIAGGVIADTGNHRIVGESVSSSGAFGSLGSGVNQFNRPEGVTEGEERVYPERQIGRITVEPTRLSLTVGATAPLLARGFDVNGALSSRPEDWKWTSDNAAIAVVDAPSDGSIYRVGNPVTIRGVAPGKTNIKVFNITGTGGSGNPLTIPVEVTAAPATTGGIAVPIR